MTSERPAFFEGQVLAAADLAAIVESGRARDARHDRYLHDWGIAEGLELIPTPKTLDGQKYVEVTLQPGMAVDGTGREIVVPLPVRLDPTLFNQINGAAALVDGGAFFPVLLHGLDHEAPPPAFSTGACGPAAQPTRVEEAFEVTFGRAGSETQLDEQPPPGISAGPGPFDGRLWDVLLGFVQWDANIQQFTAVTDRANGVGRRYVGVKADSVAARGGTLELRPQLRREAGQLALTLGGDPATLKFGVYKGDGTVDERLTVNAKGDVEAKGTIKGALVKGQIAVQSGTATDGIILPLPPGITEDQVASGAVTLHLHLTPHSPSSTVQGPWLMPDECAVDPDRRLRCLVRRFMGTSAPESPLPAAADYLIIATVGSSGGGP